MLMALYQKVCEGIYRIRGSRSNIYLVTDPDPVLIDTGMPGDETVILQALNELGRPLAQSAHDSHNSCPP